MEAGGIEPPANANVYGPIEGGGTEKGTAFDHLPADLKEVLSSWSALPRSLRTAILAIVHTAKPVLDYRQTKPDQKDCQSDNTNGERRADAITEDAGNGQDVDGKQTLETPAER